MGNGILAEQGIHFVMNLDYQLFESITGAEILEYMSFDLPEDIRFIALQKRAFFFNIISVKKMLFECNKIVQQLSTSQVSKTIDMSFISGKTQ